MAKTPTKGVALSLSLRFPIAVPQVLFTFLLSYHVRLPDLIREHDDPIILLIALPLLLLFLPGALLNRLWAIFLITAANTAMLLKLTEEARTVEPWLSLGYVLLMLIASFSPSVPQFVSLGGLLCAAYGLSVYRFGSLLSEQGLLIPVLLVMLMVYGAKTGVVRDEVEESADTKGKDGSETMNDALTGLPNRAQFIARVWRAIHCAQNNNEFLFAVLFVDLDGFKPINDGLGHKAGDAVLVEVAKRLQACLRKGDVVARYGGDEFTLLINNVSGKADAIRVAERVLTKVKDPIRVQQLVEQRVQVGASIGIALSTNVHERPEDLIRDADLAMYHAKSQGKGNYEISNQLRDTQVPAGVREQLGQRVPSQS